MATSAEKDALRRASDTLALALTETQIDSLLVYADLLRKWQKAFNLVGPETLPHLVDRHLVDALQLAPIVPRGTSVLDMGAGAGLPSLPLAIVTDCLVVAVERVGKKNQFMANVRRELGLTNFKNIEDDIRNVQGLFDVVTARAFAPLDGLLGYAEHVSRPDTQYIFPKGEHYSDEILGASKNWRMTIDTIKSITSPQGVILRIKNVSRGTSP